MRTALRLSKKQKKIHTEAFMGAMASGFHVKITDGEREDYRQNQISHVLLTVKLVISLSLVSGSNSP